MSKYIDRAALFNSLSGAKTVEEIFAAIQAAPAADVQEIRRGRWLEHQEGRWIYAKCSVCNTVRNTPTNYCPNCGATMRSIDDEVAELPMEAYYNKDWKTDEEEER